MTATYKIYYDYHEGNQVPIWFLLNVQKIDWSMDTLIVPIHLPFELHPSEDFDPNQLNVTILMEELLLNRSENTFSINLQTVKARLEMYGVEEYEVSSFVIQVADIEDVLQFTL